MLITWIPCTLESIPPKGQPRDEKRWVGRTRRPQGRPWTAALDDFLAQGHTTARAEYDYDTLTADAVRSCLDSAIRLGGEKYPLRTIRRGDDIYVTSLPRTPPVYTTDALIDALAAADDSEQTIDVSALTPAERTRLYRALHYQRTHKGYGHITVSRSRDGKTITLRPMEGETA